ncbi:MAG: hypothetical protein IKK42_05055 [Oscillospiraceae bacterium]|nr:hypothetical protein [Oscillospiraceae bacterium]
MRKFVHKISAILLCCVMLTACGNKNEDIIVGVDSAPSATEVVSEIETGVIFTRNYINDYTSYCHSYLIPSQYELKIFQEYMREPVFRNDIDFDKYCIAVVPIQSGSGSYEYVCDGVTIDGNSLDLSYYMEDPPPFCDCAMAMYYPYALIPKEMLTEESYEGWVIPSEADTGKYYMSYLRGDCVYSRETVDMAIEICRKYNAFNISGKIMDYPIDEEQQFMLNASSNNIDDITAMQTELEAIGFYEINAREVQVTEGMYIAEPPSFPLAFEEVSCLDMLIETESREDEQEAMEYLQSFGGETYYEDIYDLGGPHITRRWGVPTADIFEVYDTFETMCSITDMPFETEEVWISIDFDYIAN